MASIDHIYVFTRVNAPEQQRLVDRGLCVGSHRDHAGQGTRNACFAFAGSYLELLWLEDDKAAHNVMAKPLGLYERMHWRTHKASPFGICVRPDSSEPEGAAAEPPFAHWDYRPDYLPEGVHIAMGCNSGVIGEPLLFQINRPFQPFGEEHTLSQFHIEKLVVTTPGLAPMSMLHEVTIDRLELRTGEEHLMEVTLRNADLAIGNEVLDLRPDLPVILRW
jgi:hypothetical protein